MGLAPRNCVAIGTLLPAALWSRRWRVRSVLSEDISGTSGCGVGAFRLDFGT